MIEKLNWDSEFFGYEVGKITCNDGDLGVPLVTNEWKNFRLIYIFSDTKLEVNDNKISEVDIKTTLIKAIKENDTFTVHPSIKEYDGGQNASLNNLALESGIYSRFKRDPKFVNDEFTRLYAKWISDSISLKIADRLLVYKEGDNIEGFVSLKFKDTYAEIGLIAVHGNSRGKGVAMALLMAAFNHTKLKHLPCIRIVTQFENTPAMKLYQKAGFGIENKKYIYHWWKY